MSENAKNKRPWQKRRGVKPIPEGTRVRWCGGNGKLVSKLGRLVVGNGPRGATTVKRRHLVGFPKDGSPYTVCGKADLRLLDLVGAEPGASVKACTVCNRHAPGEKRKRLGRTARVSTPGQEMPLRINGWLIPRMRRGELPSSLIVGKVTSIRKNKTTTATNMKTGEPVTVQTDKLVEVYAVVPAPVGKRVLKELLEKTPMKARELAFAEISALYPPPAPLDPQPMLPHIVPPDAGHGAVTVEGRGGAGQYVNLQVARVLDLFDGLTTDDQAIVLSLGHVRAVQKAAGKRDIVS